MTAFIDLRFTSASGWTDSDKALSLDYDGPAQTSVAASSLSSTLVLSGATPALDANAIITGVQVRLNASCNTVSGITPVFFLTDLDIGTLSANTSPLVGATFGPVNSSSNAPPSEITTVGGETDTLQLETIQGAGFNDNLRFQFNVFNGTSGTRLLSLWGAGVRVWANVPSMQDIVQRAFRKVAVLSKDETITGDDLSHGLDLLNDMMFGWEMLGVNYAHVERAAGEVFPIARKFVEGTSMMLASRLSQDYQVQEVQSARFFTALSRAYNLDNGTDYRDDDADGSVSEAEAEAAKQAQFF